MKYVALFLMFCLSLFAKEIHVASYNVENLFDGLNQGSEYRDFKLGKNGWSKKMAEKKFANTVKAVKFINADILALQEIENKAILKRLANKTGFKYFAFTKPYRSPVGLGVLSKYPIVSYKSVNAGIRRTRDFLHVSINIEGKKLGLWVVHFPTQKHDKSKRLKVAKTLRKAVLKSKEKDFLLLGDFNTKISSKSILQDTFGQLSNKQGFYDPWSEVSYENRYSQVFFGKKSALDRIIISEGLLDGKGLEYKRDSLKVIKGFLSDKKGYPNRWKTSGKKHNRRHQGIGYSDHFPIMITIFTNPHVKKSSKAKEASIDKLYDISLSSTDIKIKDAVVIYKNGNNVILSQKGRGIYVYKPLFDMKKFHKYDILVKKMKDYKGVREIVSLEVLKDFGKIDDLSGYYLNSSNLKNVKISDVIKNISGKYKNGYLFTKNGKIRLYDKSKKIKNGEFLNLSHVRVTTYKGKMELVVEKNR